MCIRGIRQKVQLTRESGRLIKIKTHSSCTPLSLAPLKVFWKQRLPLVCQSLSACTRGHFHLGGTYSSKREATLGFCPDTEMPRVQDKHKFQVAAQQPLHVSLGGWQAAQGSSDKVKPGWKGNLGARHPKLSISAGNTLNRMTKRWKVDHALK